MTEQSAACATRRRLAAACGCALLRPWVLPAAAARPPTSGYARRAAALGSDALAPPSAAARAFAGAAARRLAVAGHRLHARHGARSASRSARVLGIGARHRARPVAARGAAGLLSIEVLRPVPSVALIPLAMLMFGFGVRMELAIVAFATFWPMLILVAGGGAAGRPAPAGGQPRAGPVEARPGLEDRAAGDRAAAVRRAAPGRGGRAGGRGDGRDRRQSERHGLRDDDRAAELRPGADARPGWAGSASSAMRSTPRCCGCSGAWRGAWGRA